MKKQLGEIVITITFLTLVASVFAGSVLYAEGRITKVQNVVQSSQDYKGGSPAPRYTGVPMSSSGEPN